jgi:hypothetical protein
VKFSDVPPAGQSRKPHNTISEGKCLPALPNTLFAEQLCRRFHNEFNTAIDFE